MSDCVVLHMCILTESVHFKPITKKFIKNKICKIYKYFDKIIIDKEKKRCYNSSCVDKKYGRVAQLGEHWLYKPGVTGSSPVPPTIHSV